MKFALATAFAVLASVAAAAPATNALYFADKDETCSLSADNNVECVPGRTAGSIDASGYQDVAHEEDEDTKRDLERRWPTCWGSGGNKRCQKKCRKLGKCSGRCYGFGLQTCVCSKKKC